MKEWIVPIATLIICVVLPYVVNLCKKTQWSKEVKRWLAIGVSVLVGIATGIISGIPTPATFVIILTFFIAGLFSYVLSMVFAEAVRYKEENDLTI